MARARRKFTREFKVEAVKLDSEKGYSIAEAARAMDIGESLLRSWHKSFQQAGPQAFPGHGNLSPLDAELRQLTCSMSKVAQCWDNAPTESFFATLKKELVHDENYQTRKEAKANIFEYIETFYNTKCRHSSLDYVSPADYEKNK